MLDATMWKVEGTGEKVVRHGSYDGAVAEVIQMTFYRHPETDQVKVVYEMVQR